MGGMEVCQPPLTGGQGGTTAGGGGVGGGGGGGAGGEPVRSSTATPGHRDRTLVYSTVGTPDYIAPEVIFVLVLVLVSSSLRSSMVEGGGRGKEKI